ncbi:hypothetical protein J2Y55_000760 [Bosea sp. BE125]|nr:hypothetical protein [Bosea sp. BE125]
MVIIVLVYAPARNRRRPYQFCGACRPRSEI